MSSASCRPEFLQQVLEVKGCDPPSGQGRKQAIHCRLQDRPTNAHVRRLSECFVDDRVERDDTSDEFPPN